MVDTTRPPAAFVIRTRRRPRSWAWRSSILSSIAALIMLPLVFSSPQQPSYEVYTPTIRHSHSHRHPRRELVDALANVDMNQLLQQIGQVDCPADTQSIIRRFLDNNKLLIDACFSDSGYKLYQEGVKLPDAEQTAKVCASPSCMDLLSGLVLAKLPECEYKGYSPRSMAESFIRVRVDLMNKRLSPTASQFGELYVLNRVVNYLTENATIQATVETTFNAAEIAPLMNPLERNLDVVLSEDYVVYIQERRNASSSTSSSANGVPTQPNNGSAPGSSSTDKSSNTAEADDDHVPVQNLTMAYVCVAICWLLLNALYLWAMSRKFVDD